MPTTHLQRQHDTALRLAEDILADARALVAVHGDRGRAQRIALTLSQLTGLLKIHFAQEDGSLYPKLFASRRAETAEVAQRFFQEMGQIGPNYLAFVSRWATVDALLAEPRAFMVESQAMFRKLIERIRRENLILYPLADAELGRTRRAA